MKKTICFLIVFISIIGCTDRTIGKIQSYGGSAKIKCYSGNLLIYEGESTGKISSEENSDGYSFIAKDTGKLTEVSGNCIINYIEY